MIQIQKAKRLSEVLSLSVDFTSQCAIGEYIATAQATSTVSLGGASAGTLSLGFPEIIRNAVVQSVAGGVLGCIYKISVAGRSNRNNIYIIEILLAVLQDTDE